MIHLLFGGRAIPFVYDRAQGRELLAKPGVIISAFDSQSARELARPLGYDFFDLCGHAREKVMGENAKNHLTCKRNLEVRPPPQPLKACDVGTAPAPKEKSHLVLSETRPFPVCAEITLNLRHTAWV
jgi:hypothetical protein